MNQRERALLACLPGVGPTLGSTTGWNGLWQNAVGRSMGREGPTATYLRERRSGPGVAATILAELTR